MEALQAALLEARQRKRSRYGQQKEEQAAAVAAPPNPSSPGASSFEREASNAPTATPSTSTGPSSSSSFSSAASSAATAATAAEDRAPAPKRRRRFVRRGDVEAAREKEYLEDRRAREQAKQAQKLQQAQRGRENAAAPAEAASDAAGEGAGAFTEQEEGDQRHHLLSQDPANPDREATTSAKGDPLAPFLQLDDAQVFRRLRKLQEPAIYFGEAREARALRLRGLELAAHTRASDASEGRRNEQQIVRQDVEREIQEAMALAGGGGGSSDMARVKTGGGHQQEEEEHPQSAAGNAQEAKARKYQHTKNLDAFNGHKEAFVLFFCKRILFAWAQTLAARPDADKRSAPGKRDTALLMQTELDIKPFLKLLRKRQCPKDILARTATLATHCNAREYLAANDEYIRIAIGNAPWPMGVTQVGIHDRASRMKVSGSFNKDIAHVLNNEFQRKYIQALKRLMTFANRLFPNANSSKNMVVGGGGAAGRR